LISSEELKVILEKDSTKKLNQLDMRKTVAAVPFSGDKVWQMN
jgi:hypothetical protein